jgi:hypothetical protein
MSSIGKNSVINIKNIEYQRGNYFFTREKQAKTAGGGRKRELVLSTGRSPKTAGNQQLPGQGGGVRGRHPKEVLAVLDHTQEALVA